MHHTIAPEDKETDYQLADGALIQRFPLAKDFLVRDGDLSASYVTEDFVGAFDSESALFDVHPKLCESLMDELVYSASATVVTNCALSLHHLARSPANYPRICAEPNGAFLIKWGCDATLHPLLRRGALLVLRNYLASVSWTRDEGVNPTVLTTTPIAELLNSVFITLRLPRSTLFVFFTRDGLFLPGECLVLVF